MKEQTTGKIASLHIHPSKPGDVLPTVQSFTFVAGKGIQEDVRYFGRANRAGEPSRRQVSLIEREQIAEHAATLGLQSISPGMVRANIETAGINLQEFVGQQIAVGEAVLFVYQPRTPCQKMDRICQGLRQLMENARQGVMAEVVKSGVARVGDRIGPIAPSSG